LPLAAPAADQPPGIVIVARRAPTALLIWDASTAVGNLVIARRSGDDGMRALEADAVAIMAAHVPALRAQRIEVRVQYAATGVVGAAYQASTFANATQLATVAAERSLVSSRAVAWQRDLASGRTPHDLSVHVIGAFPQAQ
jgi:hypothetical protein